jgi:hypothetical protein
LNRVFSFRWEQPVRQRQEIQRVESIRLHPSVPSQLSERFSASARHRVPPTIVANNARWQSMSVMAANAAGFTGQCEGSSIVQIRDIGGPYVDTSPEGREKFENRDNGRGAGRIEYRAMDQCHRNSPGWRKHSWLSGQLTVVAALFTHPASGVRKRSWHVPCLRAYSGEQSGSFPST